MSSGAAPSGTDRPLRIALLTYSTRPRGGVVHTLALAEALAGLGAQVDVWSLARGGDTGFYRSVDPAVGTRLVPFPDHPDGRGPDGRGPDGRGPDGRGPDGSQESVGARIVRSIAVLRHAFAEARHRGVGSAGVGYDVVHAQDCITANAVDRCIRTVHHLDTFTTPELRACHERALVQPYAHVCVSAAVAQELDTGWGIHANVIANGVDATRFAAGAADAAGRRRWAEQLGPYVLSVGGIEPRKGTLELMEAMAFVRRQRPELRLVLAGGETLFDYRDYRAQVLARAAQLDIQPVLLGPVDDPLLPALVAQAEVFAFPSTKEGFGLAALEALAAGVPVVARGLPVLREVLGDAVSYADGPATFGRAVLAAASCAGADADRRAERGRALAGSYGWGAAAGAHLELYRQLR